MTRPAVRYLALAYGLCWSLQIGYHLLAPDAGLVGLVLTLSMFTPALAVVIVQEGLGGGSLADVGLRWRWSPWLVVAAVAPVVVVLAMLPASALVPGAGFASVSAQILDLVREAAPEQVEAVRRDLEASGPWLPALVLGGSVVAAPLAGATVNAIPALGEELGWRGLLQAEFGRWGFWRGSAAVGVAWGLWHAPAIVLFGHNYPDHPWLGVAMMTALAVALSPPLAFLRERAGTVLAAAVAHGTLNAVAALPYLFVAGRGRLWIGVTGVAGLAVLLAVNAAVAWARADAGPRAPAASSAQAA
jgi:membrane protease YdiL (CAAX protease family)